MVKLEIQERDGFLIMEDFPENCIFNKVKTGCGATTIALTNDENYIIAVPTTELVINKCYPPKDKNGKDITWKRSQIQAGVSPTNDRLFGLYGSFNKTVQAKLRKFLDKDGVKKIICTYDKVDKLIPVINPLEFKILVDEYHNLLKQYGFRTMVINQIIENFKCFKSHCFLTATPIPELFKPKVFAEMTEYVADWKTVDKITIYPYPCKSSSSTAAKIIRHYKDNGYFVLDGIKSEEAYFFVNSVREIKEILEEALNNYTGTILYVSHDRYFINSTASRILELVNQTFVNYIGNYDYYLEKKDELTQTYASSQIQRQVSTSQNGSETLPADGAFLSDSKLSWQEQKEQQAKERKRKSELKKTEDEIALLENRNGEIDFQMTLEEVYSNSVKCQELSTERTKNELRLEELYEKWGELAE